ncbi:E3 ubiquitin-protein ligase mib1 [Branchiostoma belcheri]|nr:E3 ubiquitin-protein ligase mib1 [Branchiostoma belcheri]
MGNALDVELGRLAQVGVSLGRYSKGDKVKVEHDLMTLQLLQRGHGGFTLPMLECITTEGSVEGVDQDGDIVVRYPSGNRFCLNPDALTKVGGDDSSALRTGDWVRVSEDHGKVQRQQVGHGGWNNDMAASLGKVGRIVHVFPDRDVKVDVGGRMWCFNPASLTKVSAPGEGGNRLSVGDLVKIDGNGLRVRAMQEGHGGWVPAMSATLGQVGRVVSVGATRVKVEVPGKGGWTYNPDVLTKVEKPSSGNSSSASSVSSSGSSGSAEISVGDLVRVSNDAARALGKVGRVVKVDSDNDMTVHIDGTDWLFNPNSLTKVSSGGGSQAAAKPSTAGKSSMCAKGTHQWNKDKCKVCRFCKKCTGFGAKCVHEGKLLRFPGGPCGCGAGDAGCERCGCCRTCAGEDDSSDSDEDISGLMRHLAAGRDQLTVLDLLKAALERSEEGSGAGTPRAVKTLSPEERREKLYELLPKMSKAIDMVKSKRYLILVKQDGGSISTVKDTLEEALDGPYKMFPKKAERKIMGDHLANIGGARALTDYLKFLMNGKHTEEQVQLKCLHVVRSLLWNFSDASFEFCRELGKSGLLTIVAQDLANFDGADLKHEVINLVVLSAIAVMHNCAKVPENRHFLQDVKAVDRIRPYLQVEDINLKVPAVLTLAYIVEDRNSSLIEVDDSVADYIIRTMNKALSSSDMRADGYSVMELAMALGALARNDANKELLTKKGALKLLIALAQDGDNTDKEQAAKALQAFLYDPDIKAQVKKDPAAVSILNQLKEHDDHAVKKRLQMLCRHCRKALRVRGDCPYMQKCMKFKTSLKLKDGFFDGRFNMCYCRNCHLSRGDQDYYKRGVPQKDYGLPVGWCRFSLKVPPRATALEVFQKWHVAFHGTTVGALESILNTGDLIKAGDKTMEGSTLSERDGHYKDSWKPAGFDTKQVFVSPSIHYAGLPAYAKTSSFNHRDKTYEAKVALQLYIKPGSYKVSASTVARKNIDKRFSDSEIEWSTDRHGVIIVYGLLVKLEEK